MEYEQQIVLSLIGVIVGFALSQSFNVLKFIRRPKFNVENFSDGIVSSYTGAPPETPSEVIFGFYLKNTGFNPAVNTRVFISDLRSARGIDEPFSDGVFEFSELMKPVDIIPPGEAVIVVLGHITSSMPHLEIHFKDKGKLGEMIEFVEADTRGRKSFAAKFHITCDSLDSFTTLELEFHPTSDKWAAGILDDMMC